MNTPAIRCRTPREPPQEQSFTSLNAEQIVDCFDFDDGEKKCFEGLLAMSFE